MKEVFLPYKRGGDTRKHIEVMDIFITFTVVLG